jgi:hypothetical protein
MLSANSGVSRRLGSDDGAWRAAAASSKGLAGLGATAAEREDIGGGHHLAVSALWTSATYFWITSEAPIVSALIDIGYSSSVCV